MIQRTRDLGLVNRLLGRDSPGTDFTEVLAEPLHVCLIEGESGAVFAWRGPGIYEVHLFFAARGRAALNLIAGMVEKMRAEFGASLFWASVPVESRKVQMFARLAGWKSQGVLEMRNGFNEIFVLENV